MSEQFSATGWYVVVGTVAGLVGGAIAALLLYRAPILTLVGVTIGAVLGAYLMYVVGVARGPADHHELARTAAEGTRLPRALSVSGASPWLALPVGALIAVAVVFLVGALLISVAGAAVEPADNQEPVA
jgi:ABC-type antimicrobial peptide transport system permease subunit